ncbi:MAG TPA: carboxypeptidase-like regulatory domain-containing protein, partial [Bryobacteraceae bacterium]|nr:carboxypeptidase-like regulatory domain-containing protein [Bryobacteraceae bacterium]
IPAPLTTRSPRKPATIRSRSCPPEFYRLTFKAAGFGDFTQQGVRVQVAQTERIDVNMKVASGTESVTVTDDAPLMKTESAEQSHNLTTERILELPLYQAAGAGNGVRYPYAFLNIEPGATLLPSGGNTDIRVNGIPNDSFGVRIEGQESTNTQQPNANHINPAVEAMQEVTLQTSNFSPEYGQVGGGLINLTAKSGTNQFHGSLFEYLQNPVFNAAQPFINVTPPNKSNDFGGSVGGPVWIPKVYNGHNKTFFFFNIEQARNTVSSAGFNTVPTAAMRQGDFSGILTGKTLATDPLGNAIKENTVYDPNTARPYNGQTVEDPFAGNVIPFSRLDPVALKIQNLVPQPNNGTGLVNNWVQSYTYPSTQTLITVKIDHNISDKQHLSGYYSHKGSSGENGPDGLPAPVTATRNGHNYNPTVRLNYDYSITPTLLFHFGAGWIRNLNPDVAFNGVLDYDAPTNLGLTGGVPVNFVGGVTATGFPRLAGISNSYGGVLNLGPVNANFYNSQKPTAVSALTWVKNNHTYKLGAEWRKDAHTDNNVRGSQGIFNFSNIETALPSTNGQNLSGGAVGFPYASFLLGLVDSASVETPQDPQFRKTSYALYLQDNFKVTRTLTLDYGLRW